LRRDLGSPELRQRRYMVIQSRIEKCVGDSVDSFK
jgi:hypothetical protein